MRIFSALCVLLTLPAAPLAAGNFSDAATNSYATRPAGNPGDVTFDPTLQYRTAAGGLQVVDPVNHTGGDWQNFGTVEDPDWRLRVQTYTQLQYVATTVIGSTVSFSGFQSWMTLAADPTSTATSSAIQDYYAANPIDGVADTTRIYQMLGLPDSSATQTRVLAQYWVSPDNLLRPGYNWNITGNSDPANYSATLPTTAYGVVSDTWDFTGSFEMVVASGSILLITSAIDWAGWLAALQQINTYPWSQMGYTLDWGYDTDPTDAANRIGVGYDTFGISEFILMNNADAYFAGYIAPSDLTPYLNGAAVQLVPEPSALGLGAFALTVVWVVRRRRV